MSIRVVIVGDVRLYRDGVALHLERDSRFVVVGLASGAREALDLVRTERPDVVLVDVAMADSLTVIREAADLERRVPTVALTLPKGNEAMLRCAEAGAVGYVSRDGSLDELVNELIRVARGECTLSASAVAELVRRLPRRDRDVPALHSLALTAREREILELIDTGCTNKAIAARLGIEVATAKNHVHNILEKLHVHRRGEAAAAVRSGQESANHSGAALSRPAFG